MNFYILKELIKNYYERFGTFQGITETLLFSDLDNLSKKLGKSIYNLCYYFLGYTSCSVNCKDGTKINLDEKGAAELRTNLMFDTLDSEFKQFGVTTKEELLELLGENFSAPTLSTKLKKFSKDKELEELIVLAQEFYSKVSNNFVFYQDGCIELRELIRSKIYEKGSKISIAQSIVNNSSLKDNLLKFKSSSTTKMPFIQGGVLFTNNKLTAEQKNKVNYLAILRVISGFPEYSSEVNKLGFLTPFLSFENPKKYLELLDFLRKSQKTYKQFAEQFGFSIKDQINVFEKYGMVILVLGSRVTYIPSFADENNPMFITTVDDFERSFNVYASLDAGQIKKAEGFR